MAQKHVERSSLLNHQDVDTEENLRIECIKDENFAQKP